MKDLLNLESMGKMLALMAVSEKYCEGKETIEEVLERIKIDRFKDLKDFEDSMTKIETEAELKMELFNLKQISKNKKDILVVAKSIIKNMEELTKLVEEEENNA